MQPGKVKVAGIKEEDEEKDGVTKKKRENAGSISSQDLSGLLEEGDIDEDEEYYVGPPPMQQPWLCAFKENIWIVSQSWMRFMFKYKIINP